MFIINDTTNPDKYMGGSRGYVPRDYSKYPVGYSAAIPPLNIKLIPKGEWSDRIKERKRLKSGLRHIRRTSGPGGGRIPSLNQNSARKRNHWGYCWSFGPTTCNMMVRAAMGLPYVRLSAMMPAAIIQNYQNRGLWGAKACEFIEQYGQPPTDGPNGWPQPDVRDPDPSMDTPAMRAEALKYKITYSYADIATPVYHRNLSTAQIATLLLSNVPVDAGMPFWGHDTAWIDWDEIEPGSFGPVGLNSWGDGWGDFGEYTLQGSRAVPDGAVAPLVTLPQELRLTTVYDPDATERALNDSFLAI